MNFAIENKFLRIIFIFLLVLLVLFLGKADTLKIALVGVLLLSVIVVTNVELALIILVFSGYTFNFAVEVYHLPGKIVFLYDLIIYMLFLFSLINGKKKIYKIEILFIFYVVFLIISTVLGRESLPLKLKGLIMYIRYPILFMGLMRLNITTENYKRIIKFIILMSILQVPTSIFQFLNGNRADWCGGFLARYGSGINAVLMSVMFLIILGMMIVDRIRLKYLLYSAFFMIPLVLSSARAGFIFFGVSLIFMFLVYMLHVKYTSVYSIFFTVIGIVLIFVIFYLTLIYIVPMFEPQTAKTLQTISSVGNIKKDMVGTYTEGKLRRLSNLLFAYQYLRRDILTLTFGNGPGTVAISTNFGTSNFMREYEMVFEPSISLPTFILEIGIGGVLILLIIYIYIIMFSLSRAIHIEDKFLRIISFALPGISVVYLVASIYTAVWAQEALQLVLLISFAAIIEPASKAVKREKSFAVLFLKYIRPGEKNTIMEILKVLHSSEIKTVFVVSREDNGNLIWIMDNKHRYEGMRFKYIKVLNDGPFDQIFIIQSILEKYKVNLLFLYGDEKDIVQKDYLRKVLISKHSHLKIFEENKNVRSFILKVDRRDSVKFIYFIKDKELTEKGNYLEILESEFKEYNIPLSIIKKNIEIGSENVQ
uniref:O-antigen ligase domain-containing protein n=1 Tax=candidate division WOR-3 bacterium TaxID=2052148 RepID=A0A7C3N8K1_UNCW3